MSTHCPAPGESVGGWGVGVLSVSAETLCDKQVMILGWSC